MMSPAAQAAYNAASIAGLGGVGAGAGAAAAGDAFSAAAQAALEGSGNYYMMNPAAQAAFDATSIAGLGDAAAAIAPSGGSGSAVKNAMYGAEGYGPGMTGAQTTAYDSVLGMTGSKTMADMAANSSIGSSLINGVSGVADAVGGGKNLAGIIGAVAGASEGGKPNTQTNESKIDPRMAQYLYGTGYGDTNSLLGAAQSLWKQNPTGINPTMQQGMDMTKAALTDPAYSQGYQTMRNTGMGLLGQGVAANPFTSGQASTQGLLNIDPNAAQNLMKVGRGLLPNSI
jgi:hypothetical protein